MILEVPGIETFNGGESRNPKWFAFRVDEGPQHPRQGCALRLYCTRRSDSSLPERFEPFWTVGGGAGRAFESGDRTQDVSQVLRCRFYLSSEPFGFSPPLVGCSWRRRNRTITDHYFRLP